MSDWNFALPEEDDGPDLKTVHFIFNKHYIDVLRRRK